MVWFGFDRRFEPTDKINGFWFTLIEFGLVWFWLDLVGLILTYFIGQFGSDYHKQTKIKIK